MINALPEDDYDPKTNELLEELIKPNENYYQLVYDNNIMNAQTNNPNTRDNHHLPPLDESMLIMPETSISANQMPSVYTPIKSVKLSASEKLKYMPPDVTVEDVGDDIDADVINNNPTERINNQQPALTIHELTENPDNDGFFDDTFQQLTTV